MCIKHIRVMPSQEEKKNLFFAPTSVGRCFDCTTDVGAEIVQATAIQLVKSPAGVLATSVRNPGHAILSDHQIRWASHEVAEAHAAKLKNS